MTAAGPEFLVLSEAVGRLEAGMYGGEIRRPQAVEDAKAHDPDASIGWGPHKQTAAAAIDAALNAGKLSLYVFGALDTEMASPFQVPRAALVRLLRIRGGLPDHAVRPSINLVRDQLLTVELFNALSTSALFVRRNEFYTWYDNQKKKRRWSSQRMSNKARVGRPSKQNELLAPIRARVEEGSWSGREPVAKLVKLLGLDDTQRYTVKRTVDQIFRDNGDFRYRIIPRRRSKSPPIAPISAKFCIRVR